MTYEDFLKQLKKVRAQHQTPMVKLNFALQAKKPDHYSKRERGLEEMTVREFLQIQPHEFLSRKRGEGLSQRGWMFGAENHFYLQGNYSLQDGSRWGSFCSSTPGSSEDAPLHP